ncbi:MAG: acyltransferase [Saprospiraceae bacterium]|nr:acyltransferase [Saprospiraceae bacterium]
MGQKVLIGCGSKVTGPIKFGNNILLAQNVVMSGLNHDYEDPSKPIVDQGFNVKEIVVEDGVWMGAGVIVTPGVRIGRNAVVGAGSVVTRDVPPYSVVVGNPARIVKYYDFKVQKWIKTSKSIAAKSLNTEGVLSSVGM